MSSRVAIFHGMRKGLRAATREMATPDGVAVTVEIAVPEGAPGLVVFVDALHSAALEDEDFLHRQFIGSGVGTVRLRAAARPSGFDADRVAMGGRRSLIDAGVERLIGLSRSLAEDELAGDLALGYFASDSGAAMALIAAADLGETVRAVVSVGGRPDLAGNALGWVETPTLLIVGEQDDGMVAHNELACDLLEGEKELEVIEGVRLYGDTSAASTQVATLAGAWFREHLGGG